MANASANLVSIRVDDKPIDVERGKTLLNAILNAHIVIETACGGQGTCHLCRLTVVGGQQNLPPASTIERRALGNVLIAQGMRLACQIRVDSPLEVKLPQYRKSSAKKQR